MYKNRIKRCVGSEVPNNPDVLNIPCENLGTLIANQMYYGTDSSNSTLLSGQFDPEDSFDVDPACDFSTDRFGLVVERPPLSTDEQSE